MNQKEIIKGSIRILGRNKMRTFFMIIGIIIGITALTITFTIGKGSQKLITERAKKYLGTNTLLVIAEMVKLNDRPEASNLVSSLTLDDAKVLQKEVPNVSMVDPVHMLPNQEIIANGSNVRTLVKGTSAQGKYVWNRNVIKGEYFSEAEVLSSSRVALIGTKVAEALFKGADPVGAQIRIGNAPFIVKGVLEPKGVDPHGNDMDFDVVVPVTTLMRRLTNVDYISMIKVVLKDESKLDETVTSISGVLKERHRITDESKVDFNIITPAFVKQKIEEMTRVFNVFLPLISLVALLASGIVIVVLMLIATNERVGEIGLRVATGARPKDIQRQFMIETSIISILGGVIGIVLGMLGFTFAAAKMGLPFFIPWQILLLGTLLPMLVGILSGIIPARKAAKLNPVEALR
jgi:putative ABC transport system permease protein